MPVFRPQTPIGSGIVLAFLLLAVLPPAAAQAPVQPVLVDGFEQDAEGADPSRWWGTSGYRLIRPDPANREEGEYFAIHKEGDSRFLRLRVVDESVRLILPNGRGMDWKLASHPRISWRWRANHLPPGAREDTINDTGGAVYVIFTMDRFRGPRSIKYTYSSTLPVGTVLSKGRLKIVVVSSGLRSTGEWLRVERDVEADYRRLFGRAPPDEPVSIAIWSDSDTTHSMAEIDFDDLMLLPAAR